MDDNITRQAEEVEALISIYGDQCHVEEASNQSYSVNITEGGKSAILYITLPPDYPSDAPPIYQISAPSLGRQEKLDLSGRLENIYVENIGESILYQWVEAVKDFLREDEANLAEAENAVEGVFEEELCATLKALEQKPERTNIPRITHGETITDRKSIFQGHAASVTSTNQVKLVLAVLMENRKIASATHNIYAYRLQKDGLSNCIVQDCEDDGETAAGGRLLHLLQIMDAMNVMVVVTRWYGGVHLGPDRFRHINNAARQVLQSSGLVVKKK